jgi:hypothetical protein
MSAQPHQHQALLIFAKNPRLGHVKTRLARELGDEQALEIYHHLLRITRRAAEKVPFQKFLFYSDFVEEYDDWNGETFNKRVQDGATLGERMCNAFQRVFAEAGVSRAVIVGSDCPDLSADLLTKAFLALETHDFVLGPARDGGYYLLGMKQWEESVFQNKRWSTPTVLADTLADLRRLGRSFYLLPVLSDVDQAVDLPAEVLDQITGYQR